MDEQAAAADRRPAEDDEDLDELVAQARAGRPEAFSGLWSALSPTVAGYLRSRGVAAGDVDDVTSEVFLAALRGLDRFVGAGDGFRRWLFTIAHHKATDWFRVRGRLPDLDELTPESDPRCVESAEEAALPRLQVFGLRPALDGLPAPQREVLLLRVLADLPVEEIAALLGRTPGAVRQAQKRAVASLRAAAEAAPAAQPTEEHPQGRARRTRHERSVPGRPGRAIAQVP